MSTFEESVGFVIHSRRYRENSRILELYTRDHGRVALLGRISVKRGGKEQSALQPFQESLFYWRGKSELKNLQTVEATTVIELNQEASICGLYCNELLLYLLDKQLPQAELYDHYKETLAGLSSASSLAQTLRKFEIILLEQLGYGLDFSQDAQTGEALDPEGRYYFHPEVGVSRLKPEQPALAVSGACLVAIRNADFSDRQVARIARQILSASLQLQLGGRQLKSRQLMQSFMKYRI